MRMYFLLSMLMLSAGVQAAPQAIEPISSAPAGENCPVKHKGMCHPGANQLLCIYEGKSYSEGSLIVISGQGYQCQIQHDDFEDGAAKVRPVWVANAFLTRPNKK